MKSLLKLTAVSAATLLLAGCFSAGSSNKDAPLEVSSTTVPSQCCTKPKEYVLSGDFLFDFDKSNLSEKGKSTLDQIAKEVKASGAKNITVTGYTDRLGSAKYNLRLSQDRANTAKAYLQEQGVTANIKAIGRGKANQVVACKSEKGQALKDCLKPNRRVVIRPE